MNHAKKIALISSLLHGLLCSHVYAQGFSHPGVLLNLKQLEFVKNKIVNNEEPWFSRFNVMKANSLSSVNYEPTADWNSMNCGGADKEGLGNRCIYERTDARAAYTQALMWFYSGNPIYANNAVKIMNAWSSNFNGNHGGQNQALQASWALSVWARAAEIIKYTYNWPTSEVEAFKRLINKYLNDIDGQKTMCHFGNWQAVITEAKINSAVFLDDPELFNSAVARFRSYLPAYIYRETDGGLPVAIEGCKYNESDDELKKYWSIENKKSILKEGHAQETCRDLEHLAYGFAGYVNTAQTAYIQGVDLYSEGLDRMVSAMEFNTSFDHESSVLDIVRECGHYSPRLGGLRGTLSIAYNHYHNDNHVPMEMTEKWLATNQDSLPEGRFHYLWESLTHQR